MEGGEIKSGERKNTTGRERKQGGGKTKIYYKVIHVVVVAALLAVRLHMSVTGQIEWDKFSEA